MVQTEYSEGPARSSCNLPRDDLFHILSNQRRRYVLQYLTEYEGPVEMRIIAEQVAAWEHNLTVESLNSAQRKRVYIPLYQNHLPKLAEHNIIEYNQARGRVEATPRLAEFLPYLEEQPLTPPGSDKMARPPPQEDITDLIREVTSISAITAGLVVASRIVSTRILTVIAAICVVLIVIVTHL